ncbi:PqiC family protein [Cupriavidus basilensis]|uniref:Membrane integrity-associated transporter subunit PqiC n=1 Tax=Cupriavidus basilensis TaxID=68895 RepID=A0A643G3B9_9BURK|nr:PqiC family protein [Cupriavidus basilensis]QOT77507.1 membrane integrity-associated transporter subunit PqiC [Cupriavidus basilensis]
MRPIRSMAAVLGLAVLGGCASSPQPTFYTLTSARAQERTHADVPAAIAIGPVAVPEMVDRPQLVLRVSATQVRLDEFARWAEPLKRQIPAVLSADLAQFFPGALVSSYPQWADPGTAYLVSVDVQTFDSAPGDAAVISVVWSVRPPKQGPLVSGRSDVREPAGAAGYDALVDAHSRALAAVSRDIAGAIRAAGTARPQ